MIDTDNNYHKSQIIYKHLFYLAVVNMAVEGLVALVELGGQAESDDVVVGHHCDGSILLSVFAQECLHVACPPPQVGCSLVDERLLHVLEYQLHRLNKRLLFVGFDDLSVLCLVFFTLVAEHPECSQPFNFRKIIARVLRFLDLELAAEIARTSEPLSQQGLNYDGTAVFLEDFVASHQGSFKGGDKDHVRPVPFEVLLGLLALAMRQITCRRPSQVMGASKSLSEYLTVLINSWLAERCSQSQGMFVLFTNYQVALLVPDSAWRIKIRSNYWPSCIQFFDYKHRKYRCQSTKTSSLSIQ